VNALLDWYAENARQLPWRVFAINCSQEHSDTAYIAKDQRCPYVVWVSEIMLQQTRVETVIPYFTRWIERFPTVTSLAAAPLSDVLSTWEGLGYYSRARNLWRAAQIVADEYAGEIPGDVEKLRRLPGIGRYTAGAIASIAFGLDEAALDGNIRRVLARWFNVSEQARSPAGERRLWELAWANLPAGKAGDFNQALMDLGALICTPRSPACTRCPLAEECQAYRLGIQEERPVLIRKAPIPHHTVTAAVIVQQGRLMIAQRPEQGLLGGLWEFPGGKLESGESLTGCLRREIREETGAEIEVGEPLGIYRHAYTHFRVTLHAFWCSLKNGNQPQALEASELRWVEPVELSKYAMGKIDRQIANEIKRAKVGTNCPIARRSQGELK
jgi:A/G-specific adenine glycosylase